MNALELLRSVAGSDDSTEDHPHDSHHFQFEYDDLEPRQLLSAVQSTTSALTTEPAQAGATGPAAVSAELGTQAPGGSSVVTHAVGDINYLQSQIPLNDIINNLSATTDDIYSTATGISAAAGLTSLPITPLLSPSVTSNETPLNNGTYDPGTVWITMPPETPGIFHLTTTEIPSTSNTMMQTVNPQGGVPTFTHFGQASNGSMNGAAVNQAVAVGPVGPSMTEEIEPVQPPTVESHQIAGPPPMVQQDETTPQQDAQTPPGGQRGAGQLGTPGQEAAPGQPATSGQGQQRGAGGETTQGVPSTTPHVPAGQQSQGGGNQGQLGGAAGGAPGQTRPGEGGNGAQGPTGGAPGGAGGSGGAGAFLLHPGRAIADPDGDLPVDLIDAAIPALVSGPDRPTDDVEAAGALPTVFGAAAVAVGGMHLALAGSGPMGRGLAGGSPRGGDPRSRRNSGPLAE